MQQSFDILYLDYKL